MEAAHQADRKAYHEAKRAYYTAFENFPAVKDARDAMEAAYSAHHTLRENNKHAEEALEEQHEHQEESLHHGNKLKNKIAKSEAKQKKEAYEQARDELELHLQ